MLLCSLLSLVTSIRAIIYIFTLSLLGRPCRGWLLLLAVVSFRKAEKEQCNVHGKRHKALLILGTMYCLLLQQHKNSIHVGER